MATLVDVRAVAASRRPGFSKRQLAAGLDAHGMSYVHLQKLGTPKEGRLAARSGQAAEMLRIYERHLETPEAQHELEELTALAKSGRPLCLLCYERDPAHCHRQRLAAELHNAARHEGREFVLRAGGVRPVIPGRRAHTYSVITGLDPVIPIIRHVPRSGLRLNTRGCRLGIGIAGSSPAMTAH